MIIRENLFLVLGNMIIHTHEFHCRENVIVGKGAARALSIILLVFQNFIY